MYKKKLKTIIKEITNEYKKGLFGIFDFLFCRR